MNSSEGFRDPVGDSVTHQAQPVPGRTEPAPEKDARPLSLKRRRRVLAAVAAGAALVSVGGLGGALLVKSPQQVAAEAAPPDASVITAPVEKRELTETVVLRGSVVPGKTIEVPAPETEAGRAVVTRRRAGAGDRVKAGDVVIEVSGRPVIALKGKIPAYRDIHAGDEGPDVKQLQAALRGIGFAVGDRPGVYGPSTQAAVKRMFENRKYAPTLEPEEPTRPDAENGAAGQEDEEGDEPSKKKPGRTVVLKAGEVVFVPEFPARVTQAKAGVGAEVEGTMLTLAAGDLEVRGSLTPSDRKLVKKGMKVTILSEDSGVAAPGRVAAIGSFQGGGDEEDGADGAARGGAAALPGHPITVRGTGPLPAEFAGKDVRLTIQAASTDGPVLVVPSSAIYAAADGSTQVTELGDGGTRRRVPVTVGASGDGYVEVRGEGLAAGDRVVVGA